MSAGRGDSADSTVTLGGITVRPAPDCPASTVPVLSPRQLIVRLTEHTSVAGQQSPRAAELFCARCVAGQQSPRAVEPFCARRVAGQQSLRAVAILCCIHAHVDCRCGQTKQLYRSASRLSCWPAQTKTLAHGILCNRKSWKGVQNQNKLPMPMSCVSTKHSSEKRRELTSTSKSTVRIRQRCQQHHHPHHAAVHIRLTLLLADTSLLKHYGR